MLKIGDVLKHKDNFYVIVKELEDMFMLFGISGQKHYTKFDCKNYFEKVGKIVTGEGTLKRLKSFIESYTKGYVFKESDNDIIIYYNDSVVGFITKDCIESVQYFESKNKTVFKNKIGEAMLFLDGNQTEKYMEFIKKV